MLIKLLMLLLIILIALFLIIFLEPIHIDVYFDFIQGLKKGRIELKYYFIKIIKSIDEGYIKISFDTRFFSKNLKVIYPEDDNLQEGIDDNKDDDSGKTLDNNDNSSDADDSTNDKSVDATCNEEKADDNSTDTLQLIRKYYPEVIELKGDIIRIILTFKKIIFLDENCINLAFGLIDNNITIKISTFLWAITAPFYATGLRILIKPVMNEFRFDLNSRLNFQLSLLVLLQILLMIVTNKKLLKLIIGLYKELN